MNTIYDLSHEYKELMRVLEGFDDPKLVADSLESHNASVAEKLENTAKYIADLEALSAARKAEIDRISALKKTTDAAISRLKSGILIYMQATDNKKIETPLFKFGTRKGSKSVVVDDIELLPSDYIKTVKTAIKADIKKAIESGQEIAGAHLATGDETLTIR